MTNQPDKQTETDLDEILANHFQLDLIAVKNSWGDGAGIFQLKRQLEAWSRQQTAQVLDRLLERQLPGFGGAEGNVPVSAIVALRVGLEGKQ